MGTSIEVEAYGGTDAIRRAAIDEAFKAFVEIDRLMSNYRDDGELSFINRGAAQGPIHATFVEINGRKFGHVLDPRTLYPSDAALSVTILSRDGTMADAMSKAVFILGPSAGLMLVDSFPGMSAVIAYRRPEGTVALAISPPLRPAFHPAVR